MSAIIYEKTANGLYPTGQRTVATFPSGLLRVEQNFVCKTSAEATHRAALAVGEDFPNGSYPAIDGLKIFPEVQEIRRADGFTEFKVSAFGRVNTTGTSFLADKTQVVTGPGFVNTENFTGVYRNKYKTTKRVIPKSTVFTYDHTGVTTPSLIEGLFVSSMSGLFMPIVTSTETVDFGHFIEVTYVIDSVKIISPL